MKENYYLVIKQTLIIMAEVLGNTMNDDQSFFSEVSFSGRDGSTRFEEEFLKPLVRKNELTIIRSVNSFFANTGSRQSLLEIDASENVDEASARSLADIRLKFHWENNVTSWEDINVKLTLGKSADNIGGWAALSKVIFNKPELNREKLFIAEAVKFGDSILNAPLSDYFLWVFDKNAITADELIKSGRTHSLLTASPESLSINPKQPFPLQFNSSKDITETILLPADVANKRKTFVQHISSHLTKYYAEKAKSYSKLFNTMNEVRTELDE